MYCEACVICYIPVPVVRVTKIPVGTGIHTQHSLTRTPSILLTCPAFQVQTQFTLLVQ